MPVPQTYACSCEKLSRVVGLRHHVAVLQGIAASHSQLAGPSCAFMHQDPDRPIPPAQASTSYEGQAGTQQGQAAGANVLQPLPNALTSQERDYLLSANRPQQPPWGNAARSRPAATGVGRGKGERSCPACTAAMGRHIPFTAQHKSKPVNGRKAGCETFKRQCYLWKQYYTLRGEDWRTHQ